MITNDEMDSLIRARFRNAHAGLLVFFSEMNLHDLLRRENPYQLSQMGDEIVGDLIRKLLSKQVETWVSSEIEVLMEALATRAVELTHGGRKSERKGISFEFACNGCRYIVALVPSPTHDAGNEILEVEDRLHDAGAEIQTQNPHAKVVPVVACYYGKGPVIQTDDYFKYCGQDFWKLVSSDDELYTRITTRLRQAFMISALKQTHEFAGVVNRLSSEFWNQFCDESGRIDWQKVTAHLSSTVSIGSLV